MPRLRARDLAPAVMALASFAVVAACSLDLQGSLVTNAEAGADPDASGTDAPLADGEVTDATSTDGGIPGEGGPEGSPTDAPIPPDVIPVPGPFVWAHSSTDLYKIDLGKNSYTSVPFQACAGVQDMAVDPTGLVDVISTAALYRVGATGACTKQLDAAYPFTLSYAAAGTVQPQAALVAYEARDYVRFDATGAKTKVKDNALGSNFAPSGDVACAGTSCYVSVVGNGCADCLQELDATTGTFIKDWGQIGYAKVHGLACAAGKVYGFTEGGVVLEMKLLATGLVASPMAGMPTVPFIGAGSPP